MDTVVVVSVVLYLVSALPGDPPIIREQPSSVVARRNDPATLNCAATPGARITWYRDGKQVVSALQDPRSHRVQLPSGSLFFLRVTTTKRDSDAGTYWCVASNSHGATRSHNATLTVAMLAYDFQRRPDPVVKVLVGDAVTLTCRPPRGTPTPEVTWLMDGLQVGNSSRVEVTKAGDLTISRAVEEDSALYVCRAQNAAGTREAPPTHLTVMTPPWFKKRPSNVTVASGVLVELECEAQGYPAPTVTWRRLDSQMPQGGATIQDQQLVLRQVVAEDSGVYVCEAESEAGSVAAQATLTVLNAPNLTQRPQHQQVMVEEEAQLRCRVEGQPKPLVLWRLPTLDRTAVLPPGYSSSHVSVSEEGSTLVISKATTQDSGTYYCWGVSSGGGVSGRAEVAVMTALPPPVIGVGPKDLRVAPGGTATFPCEAVSEATVASVTWWYRSAAHLPPRQLHLDSLQPRISLPENGALIIRDVRLDDAGIYRCQVAAATGSVQQEAILRVTSDAGQLDTPLLPPPPSKPRLLGLNQTAVKLRWLPNSQGGEAQHQWYSVEYWRQGWAEWRVADAVITQELCVINQLTPGHTYTFLVRAVSTQGASFPSPWSDPVTTRAPRDPTLTMDQVRQARRHLARPVVTLTAATSTAPNSVLLTWNFMDPLEDWVEGVLVYGVKVEGVGEEVNTKEDRENDGRVQVGRNVHVTTVLGISSTSHPHNLHPNTNYTFFLVPFWRSVEGTPSNSISLTTPEDVPLVAPSGVEVRQQEELDTVVIRWRTLSAGEARGQVVRYEVILGHNGTHTTHFVTHPWLQAQGLLPGRVYTVRVAALTSAGKGPFSTPVLLEGGHGAQSPATAEDAEGGGGSVLYAPPQPAWLAYLLIPLVLVLLMVTPLAYLRRVRRKAHSSSSSTPHPHHHHHAPALYQDPSINMYNDQKLWRPSESDKDSSLSSSRLLRPEHLVNEYAEPRVHQRSANQTTEPYATTALLAPPSPRAPWRHPTEDPALQVNWSAILPPPPACPPPPDLDTSDPIQQQQQYQQQQQQQQGVAGRPCSPASQYDNMGVGVAEGQYGRPCDNTSEHTYEPYSQVATAAPPSERFLTFSSLQKCVGGGGGGGGLGDKKVRVECHLAQQSTTAADPPRSSTH